MKKFAPGLLPTLMAVPLVVTLLVLSAWQINRYFWKVELLDNLNQQLSQAAVPLPAGNLNPQEWSYRRVTVTGTYLHDKEIHLFSHAVEGRKGFQIITPLQRSDGKGIVLVNRGWVPEDRKTAVSRLEGNVAGEVTVSGIVRKPWGKSYSFMPESNKETNVWLYGELKDMGAYLKLDVAPVFVELDDDPVPGGYPIGGQTRISVPNNHLAYSVTWLFLGGALFCIYVIFGMRRAKELSSSE